MAVDYRILNYLPTNYKYKIQESIVNSEYDCFAVLRCNVFTKEDSIDWIQSFSRGKKVVWRVWRTYPDSGRYNVFKITYRCQHNSHRKLKQDSTKSRTSKVTGCTASITLTVKRYVKKSKGRKIASDEEKALPCTLVLSNIHNHNMDFVKPLKRKRANTRKEAETPALVQPVKIEPILLNPGDGPPSIDPVQQQLAEWLVNYIKCGDIPEAEPSTSQTDSETMEQEEEPTPQTEPTGPDPYFRATYENFCIYLEVMKTKLYENPSASVQEAMKTFISNLKTLTKTPSSICSALTLWGLCGEIDEKTRVPLNITGVKGRKRFKLFYTLRSPLEFENMHDYTNLNLNHD